MKSSTTRLPAEAVRLQAASGTCEFFRCGRGCAGGAQRNSFSGTQAQPLNLAPLLAHKGLRAYPLFLQKREAHKKEEDYMNGAGWSRISIMSEICVDTACRLILFPVSAAQFVAVSVGLFPDKTHVR